MRQIDFSNQRELGERNERNRYFLSIYLAELGLALGRGAGRDLPDRLCLGCKEQECDRQVKGAR